MGVTVILVPKHVSMAEPTIGTQAGRVSSSPRYTPQLKLITVVARVEQGVNVCERFQWEGNIKETTVLRKLRWMSPNGVVFTRRYRGTSTIESVFLGFL